MRKRVEGVLLETGTPEGAKKGWQSRQRLGSPQDRHTAAGYVRYVRRERGRTAGKVALGKAYNIIRQHLSRGVNPSSAGMRRLQMQQSAAGHLGYGRKESIDEYGVPGMKWGNHNKRVSNSTAIRRSWEARGRSWGKSTPRSVPSLAQRQATTISRGTASDVFARAIHVQDFLKKRGYKMVYGKGIGGKDKVVKI